MNIFSGLRTLEARYEIINERPFSQKEIDMVEKAEIVTTKFGYSVCFFMKSGDEKQIPVSTSCDVSVGQLVNMNTSSVLTLERNYDKEYIYRIKVR